MFTFYFSSLIPNINLTNPLKNLGTFFTTTVIYVSPFLQHASQIKPTQTTPNPIINSQPVIGSNKTIRIPNPSPIKHTPNVFLNKCFILLLPLFYIICNLILFVPFYVYFV